MLRDSKSIEKKKFNIPNIQRCLFWAMLFITPLAIMPFPWDWTERSMSLVILVIATIIIGLEVIKLIWEGKSTFLKGALDGGIFAVLLAFTLSTLLSKDFNSSIWGADGRLGSGLLVLVTIALVSFCARTFLRDARDIRICLISLITGFAITNLLSILSFLGVNVWGFIPVYKDLNQIGLPLLRSSKIHLLLNFIVMLLNIGLIADFLINKEGKQTLFTISIISGLLSAINIWIYSINQGIGLIILFILILVALWFLGVRRLKVTKVLSRDMLILLILTLLIVLIPTILLQIPSLREILIPKTINLVAQVSLGADVSWVIAASVFVASFARGLFGMGMDTYSISYNLYKPLNQSLLQYNNVNFYYSGSEVFTQFANCGLVWLIAWGFLGILIIKMLKKDIGRIKIYKEDVNNSWFLILFDVIILFIYLASFFATYSVLALLAIFTLIALRSVVLEVLNKGTGEKFIIKLWTASLKPENEIGKVTNGLGVGLSVIVIGVMTGLLVMWGSKTISSAYTLKAESYYIEQNKLYKDSTPTLEQREAFINSMTYYYSHASKFDGSDPLINRKTGSMYLEKVGIAAEKYSKSGVSDDEKSTLVNNVGQWKNYALDYTRKSIDTDGAVYANWEARTQIYMGLVGMGFKDYVSDALYSLNKAIELNPLNYELYYSQSQIYVINGDKDSALAALTKELGINPQHIPSLLLAADINNQKGNTAVYESYLKAAKKILETNNQTDTDVYNQVSKKLNDMADTNEGK